MIRVSIYGLLIAIALAVFLAPFASQSPDGLEKVAEDKGFLEKGEREPMIGAPLPDYSMPGVKHEGVSTALAGIVGTIITFAAALGIGYLIKKKKAM